jgi:hypothetical protein
MVEIFKRYQPATYKFRLREIVLMVSLIPILMIASYNNVTAMPADKTLVISASSDNKCTYNIKLYLNRDRIFQEWGAVRCDGSPQTPMQKQTGFIYDINKTKVERNDCIYGPNGGVCSDGRRYKRLGHEKTSKSTSVRTLTATMSGDQIDLENDESGDLYSSDGSSQFHNTDHFRVSVTSDSCDLLNWSNYNGSSSYPSTTANLVGSTCRLLSGRKL